MTRRLVLQLARLVAPAALALLALATAGCDDGDCADGSACGAVSVRWRLVDLSNGRAWDPIDVGKPDGSCLCIADDPNDVGGRCNFVVHRVRLELADPGSGAPVALDDADVVFACRLREATTRFKLPVGRHALSLLAYDPATGLQEGDTPPPIVREIKRAEITNLDVISIGVHAPTPGAAFDLAPPPDLATSPDAQSPF